MITIGDHSFSVGLDSGALGPYGIGWPQEWLSIWTKRLRPADLPAVTKTFTLNREDGNFRIYKPWQTYRSLGEGNYHNAYGLANPGLTSSQARKQISMFCSNVGFPMLSVYTNSLDETAKIVEIISSLDSRIKALVINGSCANYNALPSDLIIEIAREFSTTSNLPVILKLSYDQEYIEIARELEGIIAAIQVTNSIKWATVFPNEPSPMEDFGGGAVSGPIIHRFTIECVTGLRKAGYGGQIIASGGIDSLLSAMLSFGAGANAIFVASAIHDNPTLPHSIADFYKSNATASSALLA